MNTCSSSLARSLQLIFLAFLALAFSVSTSAQPDLPDFSKITAKVSNGTPATQAAAVALAAIEDRAEERGTIRVIVELRTPSELTPGEIASDPVAEQIQLDEVAKVQEAFLTDLAPHLSQISEFDIQRKTLFPFLTLRLTPGGIQQASKHPLVASLGTEGIGDDLLQNSIPQIGAHNAQASGATGYGWAVAIIDTGVAYNHSFLQNSLVSEACYSTPDPGMNVLCHNGLPNGSTASGSGRECNDPSYNCGHGTHVAGIAIGNGSARDGVALNATLISIMAKSEIDCSNHNIPVCAVDKYKETDVADALERVYNLRNTYKIASVNMSITLSTLSGAFTSTDCGTSWPMVNQYVNLLTAAHIAVVAGSGNSGHIEDVQNRIAAPACIEKVISVAAVDKEDDFWDFANAASILDILAPGGKAEDAATPHTDPIVSSILGGGFGGQAGTSMASPHIAGAIAAMRSLYPYPTVAAIEQQLEQTGKNISFTQGTTGYTKPRVRLDIALNGPAAPSGKPSTFTVSSGSCYGQNTLSWPSVSGAVTEYQVEGSPYSSYTNGSRWYAGPNTSRFVNVSGTTYFRVRACNLISCGPWKNANAAATVYPGCL